jgi:hypothetical protein
MSSIGHMALPGSKLDGASRIVRLVGIMGATFGSGHSTPCRPSSCAVDRVPRWCVSCRPAQS